MCNQVASACVCLGGGDVRGSTCWVLGPPINKQDTHCMYLCVGRGGGEAEGPDGCLLLLKFATKSCSSK